MSVEQKIKQLLEASTIVTGQEVSANVQKDTSKAGIAATQGDVVQPMQGSSQVEDPQELTEPELGVQASTLVQKDMTLPAQKGDPTSVKTQANESVSLSKEDIKTIFGEELTESNQQLINEVFEASVIARVNSEMEIVKSNLEESYKQKIDEAADSLVDKIDSFLNYVVESWVEENRLELDEGIKTEITEGFISGMKKLFEESYIEIPEDKVDVLSKLQEQVDSLTEKLDEKTSEIMEMRKEISESTKERIFADISEGMVATDAERFKQLIEGIDFTNENSYQTKLKVIKDTHFKKLNEAVHGELAENTVVNFDGTDRISRYAQSISNSVKR